MRSGGTVVVTFGRFQPPTTGHLRIVRVMEQEALNRNADACILFPSPSVNKVRNPIPFDKKVGLLKRVFPHITVSANPNIRTPYAMLFWMCRAFKTVVFVCGDDQAVNYKKLAKIRHYDNVELVIVKRDAISGTMLRDAAAADDFDTFKQRVPTDKLWLQKNIYDAVRGSNGTRVSTVRNDTGGRSRTAARHGISGSHTGPAVQS